MKPIKRHWLPRPCINKKINPIAVRKVLSDLRREISASTIARNLGSGITAGEVLDALKPCIARGEVLEIPQKGGPSKFIFKP